MAAEAVAADPDLNFIDPAVGVYASRRSPEVVRADGALDEDRLRHNMLSSQPLCFNVFGALRQHLALADLLSGVFQLPIGVIEAVECEWAPPKASHLHDRTAFDAFIVFLSDTGERCFLAVETKYTEPFSPKAYNPPIYAELTRRCGLFRPGAAERLVGPETNQVWRMALLAASLREKGEFDFGCIAVLSLADDPGADTAVIRLREELLEPDPFLHFASYEELTERASAFPELSPWSADFNRRYLDLSPPEQRGPHAKSRRDGERIFRPTDPSARMIEGLSWRIVADLVRLYPERLRVHETHPCGGFYDCLELHDADPRSSLASITLNRAGSAFVWPRNSAGKWSWVWRGFWAEMVATDEPSKIVRRLVRHAGLPTVGTPPSSTPATLSYCFIAGFLSQSLLGHDSWACRSGLQEGWSEPGYERLEPFPVPTAAVRVAEGKAAEHVARGFWVLTQKDEPRICVEPATGLVWDSRGSAFDLTTLYADDRRMLPIIALIGSPFLP